ncbi:TPA: hypothetical protein ACSP27_003663 [Aeromonas veronii]
MRLLWLQEQIEQYTSELIDERNSDFTQECIDDVLVKIRHVVYKRWLKPHGNLPTRKLRALRDLYVEIKIKVLPLDSENALELVHREYVFNSKTPPEILHALFGLSKLKKHLLESEDHGSGFHVHLLNNENKRYQVIFTAETKNGIDERNNPINQHDVFWEPHAKGKADLTTNVPLYSKKKRNDIYTGVVSLLCGFEQNLRKQRSQKSELLDLA